MLYIMGKRMPDYVGLSTGRIFARPYLGKTVPKDSFEPRLTGHGRYCALTDSNPSPSHVRNSRAPKKPSCLLL